MNRPKAIGTACESAVVKFLRANGFTQAERRALTGSHDQGDITGTPGIAWEVKGGNAAKTAGDGLVADWLAQTETERLNASADIGVLVMARAGYGPDRAGRWWAVIPLFVIASPADGLADRWPAPAARLHLADVAELLRAAGYGQPLERVAS